MSGRGTVRGGMYCTVLNIAAFRWRLCGKATDLYTLIVTIKYQKVIYNFPVLHYDD